MRNPGGAIIIDGQMGRREADTFTCGHCNSIVVVPVQASPTEMGGGCTICESLICPACVSKGTCDPFEEKLARMESRRSMGL